MLAEIVLVFLAAAAVSCEKIFQNKVEDIKTGMMEELQASEVRAGSSSAAPAPDTMDPKDADVIRDAIQKLLNGAIEDVDYVASTSPTRSPGPGPSPPWNWFPAASRSRRSTQKPQDPSDSPIQNYHKMVGQLVNYAQKIPTRTQIDIKTGMMEELQASEVRAGSSSAAPAPDTMDPKDADVIRDAIQKLLDGVIEDVDYVARTNPTRSPGPGPTSHWNRFPAASRSSPFTPQKPQDPSDSPIQSYHRMLGQLVDYAQKMERTKIPSRTQIARMPSSGAVTPASVSYSLSTLQAFDELREALRQRKRKTTTTTTTTKIPTTKNTLCTDSAAYCRTMCFDEEKYRVSCITVRTSPKVDFSRLLSMLEALIAEYDTNITDVFHERLIKKGYESCPFSTPPPATTASTMEPTPALYDYEASNQTGAIIGKCYVCGLVAPGIPEDAHCSDAFSGEFLPLTPVDARARGKLASFRKYCKYMDMLPWYVNGTDGRSIWGKWTGGCSVRWIDLSGLYTQRACRSRHHPVTGAHFASKRMAKLEKALMRVDNGCIASPMASLVPFSRGVSLYARFHACVCTGNWCNTSTKAQHHTILAAQALVLLRLL